MVCNLTAISRNYVIYHSKEIVSAVAQWRRAHAPHAEAFCVRIPSATDLSRKRGNDSSTAKRSSIGVSVMSPRR